MKKFFKSLAVVSAIAIALFGFVACSDDDDDDNSSSLTPSTVVVNGDSRVSLGELTTESTYVATVTEEDEGTTSTYKYTLTFYSESDSTKQWKADYNVTASGSGFSVNAWATAMSGTFTGDSTQDGEIEVTATKAYTPNDDFTALETEELTDEEQLSEKFTITNGKITIGIESAFNFTGGEEEIVFEKQQ